MSSSRVQCRVSRCCYNELLRAFLRCKLHLRSGLWALSALWTATQNTHPPDQCCFGDAYDFHRRMDTTSSSNRHQIRQRRIAITIFSALRGCNCVLAYAAPWHHMDLSRWDPDGVVAQVLGQPARIPPHLNETSV